MITICNLARGWKLPRHWRRMIHNGLNKKRLDWYIMSWVQICLYHTLKNIALKWDIYKPKAVLYELFLTGQVAIDLQRQHLLKCCHSITGLPYESNRSEWGHFYWYSLFMIRTLRSWLNLLFIVEIRAWKYCSIKLYIDLLIFLLNCSIENLRALIFKSPQAFLKRSPGLITSTDKFVVLCHSIYSF